MADIPGDTGIGLDIRGLISGTDVVGVFPSGTFNTTIDNVVEVSGGIFTDGDLTGSFSPAGVGSVIIQSSNLIGVSGAIFDSGDITGSVVISSAPVFGVSGAKLDALTGSFYNLEVAPNAANVNNSHYQFIIMTSGTATNVTGSSIGSVIQFIGAGSYVSKWTYDFDFLTNIGSFI